jgi:ABC-type multidrug transport system ATPase subunit
MLLVVKNLSKTYNENVKANNLISFSIDRGIIVGVLGPNGAGKTTLVRQICGTLKPDSGQIIIDGVDAIKTPNVIPLKVGSMNQRLYAQRSMTLFEFVYYTGIYRGLSKVNAKNQAQIFIDYFGIKKIKNQLVDSLSGGESRLTGFLGALMGLRPLIILDEPTNDLDPENRIQLWKLIKLLKNEFGISFLLITHNILEAQDVVDDVLIIQHGTIIAHDCPNNIINKYADHVKFEFAMPYYVKIPEWITEQSDFKRIDNELYTFKVKKSEINNLLYKMSNTDFLRKTNNIHIIPPSLEDAYLNQAIGSSDKNDK